MSLARPEALGLLALAIPLVLLHLRIRRRTRVVVPSLLPFDAAEAAAAPPRRSGLRPRDLLGLLLELLALGCLSLAAAGPSRGTAPGEPRPLAVVLDGSASTMAAGRFEETRALAARALEAAGARTPVLLLLAAGEPRVLATAGEPREAVLAALRRAEPRLVGGAGSLAAAAEAAAASGAEVLVLTDGCDPDAPALAARPDLRVVSVGRPERNRALVGIAVERGRGDRPGRAYLRVLEPDGTVAERVATAGDLVPGSRALDVNRLAGEGPDVLPADDGLPSLDLDAPPLRVALLVPGGRPDPYLAAALDACGPLLDRAGSASLDPAALGRLAGAPDAVVVDGNGEVAGVPALVLGAGEGEPVDAPVVLPGDALHPVMRGVDPAELIVTRGRTLPALAGDAVLLRGPEGPLALAGARDGVRRVLLGFDPRESTLPLGAAWPVFLRNALLWLVEDAGAADPRFPGALLDAEESRLEPRIPRNADGFVPPSRPAPGPAPEPLGPRLALAGAALLLVEGLWFFLARRTGGRGSTETGEKFHQV